jgi:hypothetical protein
MRTAAVVVTLLAVAANAFSGIAALAHFRPVLPGMVIAGVPEAWLTFPIGSHLLAGDYSSQLGLALGFLGLAVVPPLALGLPSTLDGA